MGSMNQLISAEKAKADEYRTARDNAVRAHNHIRVACDFIPLVGELTRRRAWWEPPRRKKVWLRNHVFLATKYGWEAYEAMAAARELELVRDKLKLEWEALKQEVKTMRGDSVFYQTAEWIVIRNKVRDALPRICGCCGKKLTIKNLHVDHVKPRSLYPELALEITNMQILCPRCNSSKGNHHDTDYRTDEQREILRNIG